MPVPEWLQRGRHGDAGENILNQGWAGDVLDAGFGAQDEAVGENGNGDHCQKQGRSIKHKGFHGYGYCTRRTPSALPGQKRAS